MLEKAAAMGIGGSATLKALKAIQSSARANPQRNNQTNQPTKKGAMVIAPFLSGELSELPVAGQPDQLYSLV